MKLRCEVGLVGNVTALRLYGTDLAGLQKEEEGDLSQSEPEWCAITMKGLHMM